MPPLTVVAEGMHPKNEIGKWHVEHMPMRWLIPCQIDQRVNCRILFRNVPESARIRRAEPKLNHRATKLVNRLRSFHQMRFFGELISWSKCLRPNDIIKMLQSISQVVRRKNF